MTLRALTRIARGSNMVNDNPQQEIYDLRERITALEKFIGQHLGHQFGAQTPNMPHPQLSAISRGLYTVTNGTIDRAYDADTVVVAELADIVYTMINDLQTVQILG